MRPKALESNPNPEKDWQTYGTSSTDPKNQPRISYRASALDKKNQVHRLGGRSPSQKRKMSIEVANEFLMRSLPPIRADLSKVAENTRHFISEKVPFMHDNLQNRMPTTNSGELNVGNEHYNTSTSETLTSSGNNFPYANGINSKGTNSTSNYYNTNGRNGLIPYSNQGRTDSVDVGTTISSRTKTSTLTGDRSSTLLSRGSTKGNDANINASERSLLNNDSESEYPTVGKGKRSQSQQIIATPHQPCCECLGCTSGGTMGDVTMGENANKGAPICVLFAIFLLVSIVVIACVMVYLKAGRVCMEELNKLLIIKLIVSKNI